MPIRSGQTDFDELIASPFARLAQLIEGIAPGAPPIDLSLGEPRALLPEVVSKMLQEHLAEFGRYPPIRGIPSLRTAIADWIGRRYPALQSRIDAETGILPLNGSREGLFSSIFPAIRRKPLQNAAVLIPNPFYPVYAAAAAAANVEPIFLPPAPGGGFLPDLSALDEDLLQRTAAFYLCSPSNPEGAVATRDYFAEAIALARRYNFLLFADECYSEIYSDEPPPGALETAFALDASFANVVSFQSLSKRSGLPGLRSGFAAGDHAFIAALARFRNVACPQVPLPIQHVSAALWRDERHVGEGREAYRRNFDAADAILARRYGYRRPKGGFFLWLDFSAHGGGEAAARTLWKGVGVKILPGSYLGRPGPCGVNPGSDHARVALVHDAGTTGEALARIVAALG